MAHVNDSKLRIAGGAKIRLKTYDPNDTSLVADKAQAEQEMRADIERMEELQQRLYASNRCSLLVVLQGMDASGKDGTIKHVMTGLSPLGCSVTAFKVPSDEEKDHDFLWRIHRAMPRKGEIAVFNRSHYEDVLVVRVHELVPEDVWKNRFDQINRFERLVTELDTVVLKFFLHIGKDEQRKRFEERLRDPQKNWKFSMGDLAERALWDKYQQAYEDVLEKCGTDYAPWYVVPADHKWYRNWLVARVIVETLESLKLRYPAPQVDLSKVRVD